jgi:hypothetical protein
VPPLCRAAVADRSVRPAPDLREFFRLLADELERRSAG